MNSEVSTYIEQSTPEHQQILTALRSLIFSVAPNAQEQYKWSRPVYGLEKDFCYLKTTKKHVTIGFFDFAKIKTNSQKIEGTGKAMRHVKINAVNEIEEFQIQKMIKEVLV
ncbi:MAG: DUF1801 domain-containing protein [Saprospiraceae bacterium]|nr:DUF1801 domain-containing protein [Saprospiraceae bacterium]